MDYNIIYSELSDAMGTMHNRIESIEWWSNRGRLGAIGMPKHGPSKEDCLRMVECIEKDIKTLKHYINTGDAGVEEKYRSVKEHLNETGGVM